MGVSCLPGHQFRLLPATSGGCNAPEVALRVENTLAWVNIIPFLSSFLLVVPSTPLQAFTPRLWFTASRENPRPSPHAEDMKTRYVVACCCEIPFEMSRPMFARGMFVHVAYQSSPVKPFLTGVNSSNHG